MTWFRHNVKQITINGYTSGATIAATCGVNQGNSLSMFFLACVMAKWLSVVRASLLEADFVHAPVYVNDRSLVTYSHHATAVLAVASAVDAQLRWHTAPM